MKMQKLLALAALCVLIVPLSAQTVDKPKDDQPKTIAKKQPVLILLHSRFEDHITMGIGEDRLFRLIKLIEQLRKEYPAVPLNVSCEFSGAFAQQLTKTPTTREYLARIKALADSGFVALGYIGEDEPTYRNRPKAKLTKDMSPEQRWLAQYKAAQQFFNDYKDPLTGEADPTRSGGLRAVSEVLGKPTILGAFAPTLGGEVPYFHELRRLDIQAVVPGLPDPYFTMGIHGYRESATQTGASMAPVPEASSELFWDSGFLRASLTSSNDIRRVYAEEGKEALAKLLEKLDRSRVRLLQIEVVDYARYLEKWPDGTPKLYPLTWAYDHPDEPETPTGARVFVTIPTSDKDYANEEEALRHLLGEFLPANPGSRIVSPKELMKMARTPVGSEVSPETLKEAARDWLKRSSKTVNMGPTYVQAGGSYFSAADLFELLTNALTDTSKQGKPAKKIRLTNIYGPLALVETESAFPTAEFTVRDIARAAAGLAPSLNDQTWKPVPSNAVPARIEIGGQRVNSAQFLALMVEAYLAPSSDTKIKLRYFLPTTAPGYFFPRQTPIQDGGNIWTLRPAVLQLEAGK